jgi:hypothetical protein
LDEPIKSLPSINQSAHGRFVLGSFLSGYQLIGFQASSSIHGVLLAGFAGMIAHLRFFGKKRGRPKATQITQSNF